MHVYINIYVYNQVHQLSNTYTEVQMHQICTLLHQCTNLKFQIMKVEENIKNQIQERAAEVLATYGVELRPKGGSLIGCCPFHDDKEPSFSVRLNGNKAGQWTCFACGCKGRDIFSFVAQIEGLDIRKDFPKVAQLSAAACGLSYLLDANAPNVQVHLDAPKCTNAPMHQEKQEPPRYFNIEAEAMAQELEQTNLFKYLCGVWPPAEVKRVMTDYKVGRGHFINAPQTKFNASDDWVMNPNPCKIQNSQASSAFPSIDTLGNVHAVKIIPYPIADHRRIKDADPDRAKLYWIKPPQNSGAYFGTHLLPLYPNKPIAIVESEKTAIIGTLFNPSYVWIATAGATNLEASRSEVAALTERELYIFPDTDHAEEWKEAAAQLTAAGFKVTFRDEVMGLFPPESKLDIADIIIWEMERSVKDD